ncbi:MAG: radical SAM protein [Candidatus Obscuribacterales bacterium]|nr:radical SAM protein [Candidatus Obscuribacterales bacterium]
MTISVASIRAKLETNERIDKQEAAWLFSTASDSDLQMLSGIVRSRFHDSASATYLLMRIINYTNVCVAKCDYCSFYRLPYSPDGYVRSKEWIFERIDELVAAGGDFFGFNGGFNPKLKLDYYVDLFSSIREHYGDSIEFYALTIVELIYIARLSKLSIKETLAHLKEAGVHWITGGGAEILSDSFRQRHSPLKYTVAEYYQAQREILDADMNTTATMVIGFDETLEERLDHLETLRTFQDDTGSGLFSFLCWTYKSYNNELGGKEIEASEYLRHLAICRIYLDNFQHIRASVLTQNQNALKALHYGADDFDIPWEDEVTEMAGALIEKDVDKILNYARAEGFEPKYRKVARKSLVSRV